jgi:hypothetical protein
VFHAGRRGDVGHEAAVGAHDVVVVTREVFGELEAVVAEAAGDQADDAALVKHGEVAVDRALAQVAGVRAVEDLRNGQRSAGGREHVDERAAAGRVALAHPGEP